jgi:hypothetical protein
LTPTEALAEAKRLSDRIIEARKQFETKPSYRNAGQIQTYERSRREVMKSIQLSII